MEHRAGLGTVVREWGRIGCIGFGGPPAHIALLRQLCVERRQWLDAQEFEDAIAACNLLPGPASTELARTDRQVRELTGLLGQPQSLVSYHLGQLRAGGLVSARRSSADGRDSYYRIELSRCGELLAETGLALHPGLGPGLRMKGQPALFAEAVRVLFLCTGNSGRSQMAEALLGQLSGGAVEVASAGSHPKPLHPRSMRALRGGRGTSQEIAAVTNSATFFSTVRLHFLSAYATGHISPSSRFASSWKPKVE